MVASTKTKLLLLRRFNRLYPTLSIDLNAFEVILVRVTQTHLMACHHYRKHLGRFVHLHISAVDFEIPLNCHNTALCIHFVHSVGHFRSHISSELCIKIHSPWKNPWCLDAFGARDLICIQEIINQKIYMKLLTYRQSCWKLISSKSKQISNYLEILAKSLSLVLEKEIIWNLRVMRVLMGP